MVRWIISMATALLVGLVSCTFSSVGSDTTSSGDDGVHIRKVTLSQNAAITSSVKPDYPVSMQIDLLNMNGSSLSTTISWSADGAFSSVPCATTGGTAGTCSLTFASTTSLPFTFTPATAMQGQNIAFCVQAVSTSTGAVLMSTTLAVHVASKCTVVCYNNNGTTDSTSMTAWSGSTQTLPSSVPTYAGYTFVGWNTKSDGSGPSCAAGSTFTVTGDMSFYGKWAATTVTSSVSGPSRTYTYNADLGGYYLSDYSSSNTATAFTVDSSMNGIPVVSVGTGVFKAHTELVNVTVPSSVTTIGDNAFNGCTSLVVLDLSSCLTTIGEYSFALCSNLSELTIPASVTSIGNYAFYYCTSFTSLTLNETSSVPSLGGSSVFTGCNTDLKMYVDSSLVSAYQAAAYWASFSSQIVSK